MDRGNGQGHTRDGSGHEPMRTDFRLDDTTGPAMAPPIVAGMGGFRSRRPHRTGEEADARAFTDMTGRFGRGNGHGT